MPRQCSRISGHGAGIELHRAVFRRGVHDTNKLRESEKGKAALKLIWDFCLINRKGRENEGQKRKLPFLAFGEAGRTIFWISEFSLKLQIAVHGGNPSRLVPCLRAGV